MDYLELYFWYLHAFIIIKQRIFPISSQSSLGKKVYPERNSVNPAGYGILRDIHSVDRAEKSTVRATINERSSNADILLLCGDSHSVLPWGKNLPESDTEGCILGASLAEQLFGGTEVEGQQILYNGRELTVRGIVKEPQNIMLCQNLQTMRQLPEHKLEATETSRQAHQKIINRKSAMTRSVCSIQTSRKRLTGLRQNLSADMD